MARRSSIEGVFVLLIVVIGIPAAILVKTFESFGFLVPLLVVGVLVAVVWTYIVSARKKRVDSLLARYGDQEIVDRIMAKQVWMGQTEGQLIDSLGQPHDIDEKRLKTKSKSVWKYSHRGGNRYGLRVTVENGSVVGWDEKL